MIYVTDICNISWYAIYLKKRIDNGTTYAFPLKYFTQATMWNTKYKIESTNSKIERIKINIVTIMITASLLTAYMKNNGTIQMPMTALQMKYEMSMLK